MNVLAASVILKMEVKEGEHRVVIAKPVASKPAMCSTFRSFSELLAGAISASPPKASCSETAVPAIRPKTVRVKPVLNHAPIGFVSSQEKMLPRTAASQSSDSKKSTVVYKPLAKLVSRTTVSLLAHMGNFNPNQDKHNPHQGALSKPDSEKSAKPCFKVAAQNTEEDHTKSNHASATVDRPSYDGYNWRKYGQKQVKGSEYPRSYYKCTHPNCPVKKKVERTLEGQIAEIVYKGEHNHSKPQPPKRNPLASISSAQPHGTVSDRPVQDTNIPLWNKHMNERNEGSSEGKMIENQNEGGLFGHHLTYPSKAPILYDHVTNGVSNTGHGIPESSRGASGDFEEGRKRFEAEDDEPKSKRRKSDIQTSEAGASGETAVEPRLLAQNPPDPEVLGDGFRWRKYGQKVVRGNPYPRSYYRCTSLKCNVRKHVERASEDPKAFITTYEGKHNHEMPTRNTNQAASAPADKL